MQAYQFLSSNWLTITTVHSGKKTTPLLNHNALLALHTRNTRFAVNLRTAPREILHMSRDVIKSVHNEIGTLLHRELRDYSLGQVAFAVFQALLAITQLLCHVSTLLTSACNVNKRL